MLLPADDVIHLFMPERQGKPRRSWFHSVMADAHQLQGYEEAMIRARAGASIMGFITNNEGELIGDDVENNQRIEFEPGTFKYLSPGGSVCS